MNVNKKLDRLKQWSKERMGGEIRTDASEEFKALEIEMQLRHDGMELLKRSADAYIRSISKRDKYEDKELQLPVAYLGSAMLVHGDDFESDSEFGQCLTIFGRANERIARLQETYTANATSSWLESLERSLVQAKELQGARKKLESRRLAYDTASAKVSRLKKEDSRLEEELRAQKMKYDESNEDVYRRMIDIKEAESDSVLDLATFLDAQLSYYDRCRDVLVQIKRDWPAASLTSSRRVNGPQSTSGSTQPTTSTTSSTRSGTSTPINEGLMRRLTRSRASSMNDRYSRLVESDLVDTAARPLHSRVSSGQSSPQRELPGFDLPSRPTIHGRSFSSGGRPQQQSGGNPREGIPLLSRMTPAPFAATQPRFGLRSTKLRQEQAPRVSSDDREDASTDDHSDTDDLYADDHDHDHDEDYSRDGDDYNEDTASSIPAYAHERPSASFLSLAAPQSQQQRGHHTTDTSASIVGEGKRGPPPPPPPTRSRKPPPPPPPPLKRNALSTSDVPRYQTFK